jgi:hypothetical protein
MPTRAKFLCTGFDVDNDRIDTGRSYTFTAMYDPTQPEDQRYAKATPVGSLQMTVDNPAVSFEPGTAYYLDITPADAD